MSKLGGRVKLSCLDCSSQYLVFGANTGSLYFYDRESLRLLSLISSKEIREPITLVKLSPLGNILAIATSKLSVFILEHNVNNRKEKEKVLLKIPHNQEITCLEWEKCVAEKEEELKSTGGSSCAYFSDVVGSTFMIPLAKPKSSQILKTSSSNLISNAEHVHKCDSSIVQLDFLDNQLLISSHSKCSIINFTKQACYQVGTQRRDGR